MNRMHVYLSRIELTISQLYQVDFKWFQGINAIHTFLAYAVSFVPVSRINILELLCLFPFTTSILMYRTHQLPYPCHPQSFLDHHLPSLYASVFEQARHKNASHCRGRTWPIQPDITLLLYPSTRRTFFVSKPMLYQLSVVLCVARFHALSPVVPITKAVCCKVIKVGVNTK